MSQAIILKGGAGGVSSDDVTATKYQVLKGHRTITSDSDDEVIEGEMVNRGNGMNTVEFEDAYWDSRYIARMEQGFYAQVDQWKPFVGIPYAVLANGIHIDADKMLDTLTVAGVRGTIPVRGYHGPDSSECWFYPAEGGYVIRLQEGYYHTDESGYKPYVIAPTALVKSAVGYKPEKTLSDTVTCNERGRINTIDTGANNYKSNMSGVYGIDYGRGTFYVDLAHGNAYYIRGDGHPHVCIPADALGDADAGSVLVGRTATSKNGTKFIGTMPDYRVGRPVFEFATFNAMYVGGVADKDFTKANILRDRTYKRVGVLNYVRYAGIKDGGICIEVSAGGNSELHMGYDYAGVVLDRAIFMNSFRQIIITYKLDMLMRTSSYNRTAGVYVYACIYNAVTRNGIKSVEKKHYSSEHMGSYTDTSINSLVIDTADVNGDVFLALFANAYSDYYQSQAYGKIIYTKIELVN